MKKCLIILTNVSPDTVGESFVSNELEFHSKFFEKVIVVPLQNTTEGLKNITYPVNIDVIEPPLFSGKKAKLLDMFVGIFYSLNRNGALKFEKKYIGKSLKKLFFAGYFEARNHRCFKQCEKLLASYDFSFFDKVVIYSYWFFLPCRVGVDLIKKLKDSTVKVSFVSRAHGYDLYQYTNKLNYLPMRTFLAENTEMIFPCSISGETYLKELLPQYCDKIKHSYLGSYDNGINKCSECFHIVTCSHTVEVKRLDKFIDGLAGLRSSNAKIKWTHIGDGDLQDKIKTLAADKLDFIDFSFLGRLDNRAVMEFYKNNSVSLFVNVSKSEGLPVSIMEAISFGIPVLATDVGGTSEIVFDCFNGKLLPKDFTVKEFVDSVLFFYNMNESDYMEYRKNARSFWQDNFDAEKNYTEFSKMLANLK